MQNRREFFGALMASVVGLSLAPQQLLWQPSADLTLPALAPDALVGISAITKAMLEEIKRLYCPNNTLGFIPDSKIGASANGLVLNHQRSLMMLAPSEVDRYGLDHERLIRPAAECFANSLRQAPPTAMGELAIPIGYKAAWIRDNETGLAIRGLMSAAYDLYHEPAIRFDILMAA